MQSSQGIGRQVEWIGLDRRLIVQHEMKRSKPATLYMSETQLRWRNDLLFFRLSEILDGTPARDVLEQYAQRLDLTYELFRDDPDAYGQYVRTDRAFW